MADGKKIAEKALLDAVLKTAPTDVFGPLPANMKPDHEAAIHQLAAESRVVLGIDWDNPAIDDMPQVIWRRAPVRTAVPSPPK